MITEMFKQIDYENLKKVMHYYNSLNIYNFNELKQEYDIQFCNDIDMMDNLNLWSRNKEYLFKLFGNKLKITLELNDISHSSTSIDQDSFYNFLKIFEKLNIGIYNLLKNKLSIREIINNSMEKDLTYMGTVLEKGSKISKNLKYYESDAILLEYEQNLLSLLIQSVKTKGTLVLSIDPLDYITMSCNASNWISCHHPNHEYGLGCMSYITDNTTVIAYVTTPTKVEINYKNEYNDTKESFYFYNKIWRQIVHFHPTLNYCIQMRQYPQINIPIRKELTEILKDLLEKYNKCDYHGKIFNTNHINIEKIINYNPNLEYHYHYNDVIEQSFSQGIIVIPETETSVNHFIDNMKENPIYTGEIFYEADGSGRSSEDYEVYNFADRKFIFNC